MNKTAQTHSLEDPVTVHESAQLHVSGEAIYVDHKVQAFQVIFTGFLAINKAPQFL